MDFPHEISFQGKGKAIIACITAISASLSFLGSSLIIYILSHRGWIKLIGMRNRLLLGMSAIDILSSTAASFLSSPLLKKRDALLALETSQHALCKDFLRN